MSDHVHSFKVATTLAAYRVVALVGGTANQVQYPASAQAPFIGVTKDTVRDTNTAIPVAISGRAKLLFNDTVTAGSLVGSDTSGRGIPFSLSDTTTSVTLTGQYVGILLGASVAATSTVAEILVRPGFVRTSA